MIAVKGTDRPKFTDTHWLTELSAAFATQTVEGSPSNADAGPSAGLRANPDDPYEEEVTPAAPIGMATVWWAMPGTTRNCCGGFPVSGLSWCAVSG
jgi:hypothetical protein